MENIVAQRIQARLDALGKNPSGVALEAGLGRSSVRDILLGRVTNPRIDTLRKIAAPLQCTLDYLTGESEDPAEQGYDRKYWRMDAQNLAVPSYVEAGVFRSVKKFDPDALVPPHDAVAQLFKEDSVLTMAIPDPRVPSFSVSIFLMGDDSLQHLNIRKGDALTGISPWPDRNLPLTHGTLVAVHQQLTGLDLEEISIRQVIISGNSIVLSCNTAPDIVLSQTPNAAAKVFSPNWYATEKSSVVVTAVIIRCVRELPLSDAMRDLAYESD